MMWRRGKKMGNISPLLKIKCIIPSAVQFLYKNGTNSAAFVHVGSNIGNLLLGDYHENYNVYNKLQVYSNFHLVRMSTRIQNFQVHRQVETNYVTGSGEETTNGWFEDKLTYTDPIMYFYRAKFGRPLPGAFTDGSAKKHAFLEVCKKKCINSCKDGWYWSTNWPTKNEKKMVDTDVLVDLMNGTTPMPDTYMKDDLLKALGAVSKNEDGGFEDQHCCSFALGRNVQYPHQWFVGKQSTVATSVERFVRDFVTYDMVTYITVRAFRHKL